MRSKLQEQPTIWNLIKSLDEVHLNIYGFALINLFGYLNKTQIKFIRHDLLCKKKKNNLF